MVEVGEGDDERLAVLQYVLRLHLERASVRQTGERIHLRLRLSGREHTKHTEAFACLAAYQTELRRELGRRFVGEGTARVEHARVLARDPEGNATGPRGGLGMAEERARVELPAVGEDAELSSPNRRTVSRRTYRARRVGRRRACRDDAFERRAVVVGDQELDCSSLCDELYRLTDDLENALLRRLHLHTTLQPGLEIGAALGDAFVVLIFLRNALVRPRIE